MFVSLPELVLSAQRGESGALAKLLEQSEKPLLAFCLRLTKDLSRAQDLSQDTLIKVMEKIGSLREPARYFSWMFGTARNLWLDFLKSPRNQATSLENIGAVPCPGVDAVSRLEIQESLGRLDERSKEVVMLVDGAGLSYEQAARKLGLTPASLRCRLHRARRTFQAAYQS